MPTLVAAGRAGLATRGTRRLHTGAPVRDEMEAHRAVPAVEPVAGQTGPVPVAPHRPVRERSRGRRAAHVFRTLGRGLVCEYEPG